jgi:phosphoribosylcarboxyaminoimidazole (NCAIR) mutase
VDESEAAPGGVVRDGYTKIVSVKMMDSRSNLNDAQQAFANGAEGRAFVAHERMIHDARERHRGAGARPWTDEMEVTAIRDGEAAGREAMVADAARAAALPGQIAAATAGAEAAKLLHRQHLVGKA